MTSDQTGPTTSGLIKICASRAAVCDVGVVNDLGGPGDALVLVVATTRGAGPGPHAGEMKRAARAYLDDYPAGRCMRLFVTVVDLDSGGMAHA